MASLIWFAKNRIFKANHVSLVHLLRLCICFYNDQFSSLTSSSPVVVSQLWNWSDPKLCMQYSFTNLISWTPPPFGMLILNFDGAVTNDRVAGGFIIWDYEGSMLVIGSKLLPYSSVPFAKLIGVWLGLKYLVSHFHTQRVWIQGDSSVIIFWLKTIQHNKMNLSHWIRDMGV